MLWQLPPTLGYDEERLAGFFAQLPRTTGEAAELAKHHDAKVPEDRALTVAEDDRPMRHALEVRHASFAEPAAAELLRAHDVGFVVADTAGRWPFVEERTSDFRYVRLHGDAELYASGYSAQALDRWAAKVRGWADAGEDVFVYFDNDVKGYAPHDAMALLERLSGRATSPGGRPPRRPPGGRRTVCAWTCCVVPCPVTTRRWRWRPPRRSCGG